MLNKSFSIKKFIVFTQNLEFNPRKKISVVHKKDFRNNHLKIIGSSILIKKFNGQLIEMGFSRYNKFWIHHKKTNSSNGMDKSIKNIEMYLYH